MAFGDYVGLGAGAHGKHSTRQDQKLIAFRSSKPSQPRLYMANPKITEQQQVAADDLILEFMMNALRLTDGVDWRIFEQRTGLTQASILPVWENLVMRDLCVLIAVRQPLKALVTSTRCSSNLFKAIEA
ncbi:MAG: hypothetical protein CM15mP120_07600 [Pseudomonadota bacterium]|nr:MAG: hypothetical protein CM15mP120_07600 [Pseudomonadota bacterium]